MKAPYGVILAGGRSARMGGGDKALAVLGGRTLLGRVIERLEPQVEALALNANGDPGRFAGYGLPVIADGVGGFAGPLAGVLAGLDWAAENDGESIVTAAADTPFFPPDLAPRLVMAAEEAGSAVALAATPGADGPERHPVFGLWPVALREDLRAALGQGVRKVSDWADRHGAASAVFPVGGYDPFFNINTPDDLAAAEALL